MLTPCYSPPPFSRVRRSFFFWGGGGSFGRFWPATGLIGGFLIEHFWWFLGNSCSFPSPKTLDLGFEPPLRLHVGIDVCLKNRRTPPSPTKTQCFPLGSLKNQPKKGTNRQKKLQPLRRLRGAAAKAACSDSTDSSASESHESGPLRMGSGS